MAFKSLLNEKANRATLSLEGVLSATNSFQPFTHILKPAGTGGFEYLPIIEWLSLDLGRRVGFDIPDFALVPMPNNMAPALLIERFDICYSIEEPCRIAQRWTLEFRQ